MIGPILKLDDFVFTLPPRESLDFDMDRSLPKLDFPGGVPIYQDMGMNEKTLDFRGSIIGDGAWKTSEQIESLWWSGNELTLTYGDIKKQVRIQKYSPKFMRDDRVDYSIHLVICYPESDIPDLANVYGNQSTTNSSSSTTTSTPAALAETMDKTYTVRYGDTLWGIAASPAVFQDGTKWELLAKANGITDEYSLQVGQVIKIPSAANVGASITADSNTTNTVLGKTGLSEIQTIQGAAS